MAEGSIDFAALQALAFGMLCSLLLESLLKPRPPIAGRSAGSWAVFAGFWLIAFGALFALTHRPWFSSVNVLSFWLLLVLVSNAKYEALREPFVCADFEYFSDTIRFPRLYLPFFGVARAALLAMLYLCVLALGLYLEPPIAQAITSGGISVILGTVALALARAARFDACFDPVIDLSRFGLAGSIWAYFQAARKPVTALQQASPFINWNPDPEASMGDLVVVQSESFFDARRLWTGVRPNVLANFDRISQESLMQGRLKVAAWGANTVRTEFSMLSGMAGDALGVHRFNPYRILARRGVPSLASALRERGYRTVCIHPYAGAFYGRDKVLPALGFDEFLDIAHFDNSEKAGPFIGDKAVADRIRKLMHNRNDQRPLFIFAITMENHGPLHLESVESQEMDRYFNQPLPEHCEDLAAYVRHLTNADEMLAQLQTTLKQSSRAATLCFYGDHVPILPAVYTAMGTPDGDTEYLIWHNDIRGFGTERTCAVSTLGTELLHQLSRVGTRGAA